MAASGLTLLFLNFNTASSFAASQSISTKPPSVSLPNRSSSASGLRIFFLNQAVHRACAHLRIETFFCQIFAQCRRKFGFDFFVEELVFELEQEFVHDFDDNGFGQGRKWDNRVQAVAELGREEFVDCLHFVAAFAFGGKAEAGAAEAFRACVGGHNQDDVAEIGTLAVVVGQFACVHDLQEDVENVGVGFFDFVQEQHAMRLFVDGFGQKAALFKADVAPGGAPMRRDTAWRSMYSDISKCCSGMPIE